MGHEGLQGQAREGCPQEQVAEGLRCEERAGMKKAGKGIFAPKTLSAELSAVCGGKKTLPRTEVTKAIWVYIKAKKLNEGRIIKPDAVLKKVMPVASLDMLKMPGTSRSTSSERAFSLGPRISLG